MHTSSRVMETNPPGANRPLTNLAQSCSYSVKASRATLLSHLKFQMKHNNGGNRISYDFMFLLKGFQKTVVLI